MKPGDIQHLTVIKADGSKHEVSLKIVGVAASGMTAPQPTEPTEGEMPDGGTGQEVQDD